MSKQSYSEIMNVSIMNFYEGRGHNSAYNSPQLAILPHFLETRNGGSESLGAAWFISGDLGMDPSFLLPLQGSFGIQVYEGATVPQMGMELVSLCRWRVCSQVMFLFFFNFF